MSATRALLTLACLVAPALGATYAQTDSYQGSDFLSGFTHEAIADPTHGRVNYVDQATAVAQNLTYASGDTLILRADDTTVLSASDPGRSSVRLQSNNVYSNHVTVWNIRHMPQGCGTWPAVWEYGQDWPNQGEIDILEGVNDHATDQATLHTTSGTCIHTCTRTMTGTSVGDNCDVNATGNSGCGVTSNDASSYGPAFNAAGGGFYAMERSDAGVKVWFWSRNSGAIPSDVLGGATSVDTDNWGTPFADFPSASCDMASHFGPHNIVINLTFCGDWAGAVFAADGCPGDCTTYVDENPSAFTNAYFDVAWLKVYQ
ncbi:endo-beta-glucanase [Dichomitus squalens LYAD-421 SS1]|uniref:Endo-beta-glucanase n=1 Tax=Dichomitus squalens (strain LYAD-421) TaxID=732165 RepID=R7SK64_DICSQ|nr:endo-beta-glucanase [Dichomitus squalens LYAD-421 SS1]EJF56125.1 endo-beta-glucanase [Dichomitus squalens LYAD-421 SS1]